MPYIIDGHNLIGKIPHIHLSELDDEKKLIELLIPYCVENNKKAEIYFDNAPGGVAGAKVHGRVTARYVRESETADQAIKRRLHKLGQEAFNWTVITSDKDVQSAARRSSARVIPSEQFAQMMLSEPEKKDAGLSENPAVSDSEVDEWMNLFGEGKED